MKGALMLTSRHSLPMLFVLLLASLASPAAAQVEQPQAPADAPAAAAVPLPSVKAYPNPWKSNLHRNTHITFEPVASGGVVEIFTLSGRLVATVQAAGAPVTWNLTNSAGKRVASGVYLYTVKEG